VRTVALTACGVVALAHLWFFALESYFWTRPLGLKVFKRGEQFAKETAPLALNQGLYNGFLAAGLIWGLLISARDPVHALSVLTFFLSCVVIAGLVGAVTASRSILFVQALPGVIALGLLWAAR
jgi:putative membrane protein